MYNLMSKDKIKSKLTEIVSNASLGDGVMNEYEDLPEFQKYEFVDKLDKQLKALGARPSVHKPTFSDIIPIWKEFYFAFSENKNSASSITKIFATAYIVWMLARLDEMPITSRSAKKDALSLFGEELYWKVSAGIVSDYDISQLKPSPVKTGLLAYKRVKNHTIHNDFVNHAQTELGISPKLAEILKHNGVLS